MCLRCDLSATYTPLTGLLHDAMLFRQEPSYRHYLAMLREKQTLLQQNEVRAKEQQQREQLARDRASGGATGSYALVYIVEIKLLQAALYYY